MSCYLSSQPPPKKDWRFDFQQSERGISPIDISQRQRMQAVSQEFSAFAQFQQKIMQQQSEAFLRENSAREKTLEELFQTNPQPRAKSEGSKKSRTIKQVKPAKKIIKQSPPPSKTQESKSTQQPSKKVTSGAKNPAPAQTSQTKKSDVPPASAKEVERQQRHKKFEEKIQQPKKADLPIQPKAQTKVAQKPAIPSAPAAVPVVPAKPGATGSDSGPTTPAAVPASVEHEPVSRLPPFISPDFAIPDFPIPQLTASTISASPSPVPPGLSPIFRGPGLTFPTQLPVTGSQSSLAGMPHGFTGPLSFSPPQLVPVISGASDSSKGATLRVPTSLSQGSLIPIIIIPQGTPSWTPQGTPSSTLQSSLPDKSNSERAPEPRIGLLSDSLSDQDEATSKKLGEARQTLKDPEADEKEKEKAQKAKDKILEDSLKKALDLAHNPLASRIQDKVERLKSSVDEAKLQIDKGQQKLQKAQSLKAEAEKILASTQQGAVNDSQNPEGRQSAIDKARDIMHRADKAQEKGTKLVFDGKKDALISGVQKGALKELNRQIQELPQAATQTVAIGAAHAVIDVWQGTLTGEEAVESVIQGSGKALGKQAGIAVAHQAVKSALNAAFDGLGKKLPGVSTVSKVIRCGEIVYQSKDINEAIGKVTTEALDSVGELGTIATITILTGGTGFLPALAGSLGWRGIKWLIS